MVVDLDRSRSVSPQVYQDFMNCPGSLDPAGSLNTLPVPISERSALSKQGTARSSKGNEDGREVDSVCSSIRFIFPSPPI